jgi:threonylcarbamoyladenosine tRNA methylthiotransferase MtaB
MLLRTVTLGCKVNQYETELVRQGLMRAGFAEAGDGQRADVCLVNTCTVTHEGDAKSRQAIRRLAKENPAARIVVMGCYAARAAEEVARLPGVTDVIADKRELADLVLRLGGGLAGRGEPLGGIDTFSGRHRAWVKVQDGCLLRCSFCIIPIVRPHFASRPPDTVVAEVRRLVRAGFREIVLSGIHLGHYGVEWNRGRPKRDWTRLSHLVARLVAIDPQQVGGEFRLRLSSIEATEVTRELLEAIAAHPRRVCPHLHVSLQSGSDAVLARMRRRWGAARFVDRCKLAQALLDQPALTTDVIVGFPGETAADFRATCAVVEEVGFSRIHVFPFSPRRGTPAADMPRQIPAEVKRERAGMLTALSRRLTEAYHAGLVGRTLDVLVEGESRHTPGNVAGTACRYAAVEFPGTMKLEGRIVPVRVETARDGRTFGAAAASVGGLAPALGQPGAPSSPAAQAPSSAT